MAKLKFDDEIDTFDIGLDESSEHETVELGTVVEIPIDLIDIGENIRNVEEDDESKLRQLGDSIKADGQIEPCIVYQSGKRYVLKAGSRRYKACMLSDIPVLKCIIDKKFADEKERIIYQATENEHRDDMNPRERETYMARLMELGMSQIEIAKALHKNKGWVSEALTAHTTLQENSDLKKIIDESVSTRDIWRASRLDKGELEELKEAVKEKGGGKKAFKEELDKKIKPKKEEKTEEEEKTENEEINEVFGINFEIDNSADETDISSETNDNIETDEQVPHKNIYTVDATLSLLVNETDKRIKYTGPKVKSDFEKFIVNQAQNYFIDKGYTVD